MPPSLAPPGKALTTVNWHPSVMRHRGAAQLFALAVDLIWRPMASVSVKSLPALNYALAHATSIQTILYKCTLMLVANTQTSHFVTTNHCWILQMVITWRVHA